MGYIKHSLAKSETVLYRARLPWFFHAGGWAVLLAFAAVGAAAYANGGEWAAGASALIGVALFLVVMVPLWTTEIGVTNQRFIYKRGLLWRTTQELQLRAVEEINLDQGVVGRLLDFGRLELHGTGVEDIKLPTLADPVGLRRALQDGIASAVALAPRPQPSTASAPAA
jgi:uncharacterized membrane protein YdbT with pleckstrin-like domain